VVDYTLADLLWLKQRVSGSIRDIIECFLAYIYLGVRYGWEVAGYNVWDKISTLVAIERNAQIIDTIYHTLCCSYSVSYDDRVKKF
jgi:hypothetical protein